MVEGGSVWTSNLRYLRLIWRPMVKVRLEGVESGYLQSRLKVSIKFMVEGGGVQTLSRGSWICAICSPVWKGQPSSWLRVLVCKHRICAICVYFKAYSQSECLGEWNLHYLQSRSLGSSKLRNGWALNLHCLQSHLKGSFKFMVKGCDVKHWNCAISIWFTDIWQKLVIGWVESALSAVPFKRVFQVHG